LTNRACNHTEQTSAVTRVCWSSSPTLGRSLVTCNPFAPLWSGRCVCRVSCRVVCGRVSGVGVSCVGHGTHAFIHSSYTEVSFTVSCVHSHTVLAKRPHITSSGPFYLPNRAIKINGFVALETETLSSAKNRMKARHQPATPAPARSDRIAC
jgi:hypothetical protein